MQLPEKNDSYLPWENEMMHDRSRDGALIHEATSSGRIVTVVAYIEAEVPIQAQTFRLLHPVKSTILCRTSEQAAEVARILREAKSK